MKKLYTNRSLRKAFLETLTLCEEIKLRKKKILSIDIDSWGDVDIHSDPEEFLRIFQLVKPANKRTEAHFAKATGNLHAKFAYRNTTFTTVVDRDTPELEALIQAQRRLSTSEAPRICSAVG